MAGSVSQSFDVARVREGYPALRDGHAYLDGAAGTQVPSVVIEAIAGAYRAGIGNTGGAFAASARSAAIAAGARQAIADLVGGVAEGVVLGPSATALTYRIAAALAKSWAPGDEVVVSRLDHDSNIRPWLQAAQRAGATARWAEPDLETGELPARQYADLIGPRTRVVAVTAASNVLGTRPDVPAIAALAHAAGALCYVDGVHATPHVPVDIAVLGADFYTTSAYKWSGPHVAAVVAAPPLLETLRPDKLAPSPDEIPDRFERGTLPFADLAGITAAVNHLAGLGGSSAQGAPHGGPAIGGAGYGGHPSAGGPGNGGARQAGRDQAGRDQAGRDQAGTDQASGAVRGMAQGAHATGRTGQNGHAPGGGAVAGSAAAGEGARGRTAGRRQRVLASMAAVEQHEAALFARLLGGLASMAHITTYGKAADRAPTAFFTVAGLAPRAVAETLASQRINVWSGNNYALELCQALGLGAVGAVRAGLVHYNDESDVDRLLTALAALA
jgi:cysteine desulfurase family protein (TIGR01976 family)